MKKQFPSAKNIRGQVSPNAERLRNQGGLNELIINTSPSNSKEGDDHDYWPTADKKLSPTKKKMPLHATNTKLSSQKMKIPHDMTDLDVDLIEYGNEVGGLEHSDSRFSPNRRSPNMMKSSKSIPMLKRMNSGQRYTSTKKMQQMNESIESLINHQRMNREAQLLNYVKPGNIYDMDERYRAPDVRDPLPEPVLDASDYLKRFQFEQLKTKKLEAMCQWKQGDKLGTKKSVYIKSMQNKNKPLLQIARKSNIERLDVYTDRFPFLRFRKSLLRSYYYLKAVCFYVISTPAFDNISIAVILANSITMVFDDTERSDNPNPIFAILENVFLILYTIEMVFKILGLGFIFGEDTYIWDPWNLLDFFIVMSSYAAFATVEEEQVSRKDQPGPEVQSSGFNVKGLRVFRVLRPLKTISSIKGLKILISSVLTALPLLQDTLLILFFFFLIFAIAGAQTFSGMLKQRCVSIQTGLVHEDDLICGVDFGGEGCPGGYFCAKVNESPNYGVTNFDNIFYSILAIFQCVTLEGWSEIQRDMQKCFADVIWIFFIPLVLGGAFFLLNLTLAVINSKFTEAQNKQSATDSIETKKVVLHDDDDEITAKESMTIAQFINARIYAKRMIHFLRQRQKQKADKNEKQFDKQFKEKSLIAAKRHQIDNKLGQHLQKMMRKHMKKPDTSGMNSGIKMNPTPFKLPTPPISNNSKNRHDQSKVENMVIVEEVEEHKDDQSQADRDKLDQDIAEFLQQAKIEAKKQPIPVKSKDPNLNFGKPRGSTSVQDGPKMMGNIGVIKDPLKKLHRDEIGDLDIDNVLVNDHSKDQQSVEMHDITSQNTFNVGYEVDHLAQTLNPQEFKKINPHDFKHVPGMEDMDGDSHKDGGLISSDSDFEQAVYDLGLQSPKQRTAMALRQDASKQIFPFFKKMLTANHNSSMNLNKHDDHLGSTQYVDGSSLNSNHLEIESKFQKKSQKLKQFAEDSFIDDKNFKLQYKQENKRIKPFEKQEVVNTQKPQDNFVKLDPLTEKVVIGQGFTYQGTSQNDVIMPRIQYRDKMALVNSNQYVQLPLHQQNQEDPDFISKVNQKNVWLPYQQKFKYRVKSDSSEITPSHSENEDDLQNHEQPWQTPQRIAFKEQTKQVFTHEVAKRSDIMITSTLSMSLFPKDKRELNNVNRTLMNREELDEYIDEKNAFRSMSQEFFYENRNVKEKDMPYKDVYSKSVFFGAVYMSKTLQQFREDVQILNNNQKKVVKKSKVVIQAEELKHKQNVTASQRRGLPKFNMEDAQKLLDGEYHEEDEDEKEEAEHNKNLSEQQAYTGSYYEKQHELQLDRFEMQLRNIFAQEEDKQYQDEIPLDLKNEFSLPMRLGDYEINFKQIRKFDASKKKISPVWSGQDVLPDALDQHKSTKIVEVMSQHRVWPQSLKGMMKRARYIVRLHVKSPMYDDFFTFVVLLNSVTMAMNSYGMSKEREDFLELSNKYFTWIFIYEMYVKILGIGIKKYVADGMNLLDGFIVQVSIFELIYPIITGGAENSSVKALKTLRLLRTIRVVRIVRLLRTLESMKVIISVVKKSYMSFIYITALMFLFIFIFTLLGMSTFAGYFKDDPEGMPPNNYESFLMAFFTIFQVLTMENWQTVLYVTMRNNETKIKPFGTCILYIAWIFIGNFILLNLFLAILLDSFLEGDEDEVDQDEVDLAIKAKKHRKLEKMRRKSRHKVNMDMRAIKKMRVPSKFYFGQAKTQQEEDLEDLEDLDEDQVLQILKDIKIMAKNKTEKSEMRLFENIECSWSFYLFSKENNFRIVSYRLMKHQMWEWSVLFLIMLSSLKLAIDTYSIEQTEETPFTAASKKVDFVFNILFIIEMAVKLVAMGLIMDEGAYLRDSWNQMDFFIVMTSIVDMSLDGLEIKFIKILRMLRALRPLRFLSSNVQLKLIVNALISSLGGLFNVLIVLLVVFLIYAIVGVSLYAGKFFYCSEDPYQLHTMQECEFAGGQWMVWDHNFDNAMRGLISLYVVSSLEGWPDIMLQAIDITDVDEGPKQENKRGHMFFFVIFILIGSFFFLNFFIGVLFMKFGAAQAEEQKGYTSQDLAWMDIQRLILEAEPDYETTNVPKSKWRMKFHKLTSSDQFEGVIMIFILLNMLQMAVAFESQSQSYTNMLEASNYVFTIVFIIEAILKLIAYGTTYFQTGWNKFDFFVVSASIFDFILDKLLSGGGGEQLGFLSVGPQIARVMRVLRVTRILRLAGKAKGLQAILETIKFSLPALINVFILLCLVFFMASVLSNFTFYNITEGEVLDPTFKNFRNFKASLLLNFALSTGEDWNKVMFDCSRSKEEGCIEGKTCGTKFSFVYFVLLILVCSHVMLNLFILVIIQQFEKYYLAEDNMLGQFKNDFIAFMSVWRFHTQDKYQCFKIKENQILKFFRDLGQKSESLGFPEELYDDGDMKKNLLKMSIKSDNGYIYFNEMLYRCMRRKYGNMKINKKMQVFELRTQFNIYLKTMKSLNKKKSAISNDDIFNGIIKKENGVNPFLTVMYFKISFYTWLKVARHDLENERRLKGTYTQRPQHNMDHEHCTENAKLIAVEIEQDKFIELTSEEDEEDTKSVALSRTESKESFRPVFTMKQQKNRNYMKKFEQTMQKKLQDHVKSRLNEHILKRMTTQRSQNHRSPKYAEDTPIMHLLRSSQEKSKINQVGIN